MPAGLTVIGKYQVVDRLGKGGMGTVYLARDPALDRLVAVKVLSGDFDNEDLRERFSREAQSVSRLRHPNIVTIFEYGDFTGQPFIAMEYVSGESWAELIRRRAPVPLFRKLRMMEELCAGMAYAHRARIVHRDIKPANIMVDAEGGLIKILDFGIARSLESTATLTQVIGTPSYMSPEQTTGERVDHRSDVFAVGSVFYELLSYRQAFEGDTHVTIIDKIVNGQPRPLAEFCPDIDPKIVAIVSTAMEKDPGARYQDLEAMRTAIEALHERIRGSGVQPTSVGAGPSPPITPATPRRPDSLEKRRASQIKLHVDEAHAALAAGDYEAALEACEQILLLDASHALALDLMDTARVAMEDRAIEAYVRDARQHFERNALTSAEQLVSDALKVRSTFPLAVALQRELQQARREQEREQERAASAQAALDRARASLASGALESAVRAASEALAHDPALAEARLLREQAGIALAERRQQDEVERRALDVIAEARREFNAGHTVEALKRLVAFSPPHPLVTQALADLRAERAAVEQRQIEEKQRRHRDEEEQRQQLERQSRQRRVQLLLGQARQQIDAGQLDAAAFTLSEIERLDSVEPQQQELLRELQGARQKAEAAAARRRAAGVKLSSARQFLADNSLNGALDLVDEALRLDDGLEARALRAEICSRLDDQRQIAEADRQAQETVDRAHQLFAEGRLEAAVSLLERHRPRHPAITAAIESLRTAADAARRRGEAERREREAAERRAHQERVESERLQSQVQEANEREEQRAQANRREAEAGRRGQALAQARGAIEAYLSTGRIDEAEQALRDAEREFGTTELHQVRQRVSTVRSLQQRTIVDPAIGSEATPDPTGPVSDLGADSREYARPRGGHRERAPRDARLNRPILWAVGLTMVVAILLFVSMRSGVITLVRSRPGAFDPPVLSSNAVPQGLLTLPSTDSRPISGDDVRDASNGVGGVGTGAGIAGSGGGGGTDSSVGGDRGGIGGGPADGGSNAAGRGSGGTGATGRGGSTSGGGRIETSPGRAIEIAGPTPVGGGTSPAAGTTVAGGTSASGTSVGAATPGGGTDTTGANVTGTNPGGGSGGGGNVGGTAAGGTNASGTAAGAGTNVTGGTNVPGGTSVTGTNPASPTNASGTKPGSATSVTGTNVGGGATASGGAPGIVGGVTTEAGAGGGGGAAADRKVIEDVVEQYRQAYNRKDIDSIKQVYPRATNELTFGNALRQCASVDLNFVSKPKVDVLSDGRAQVETTSVYGCTPVTRQPKRTSPGVLDTFRLERRGSSWIIVDLLVPRSK